MLDFMFDNRGFIVGFIFLALIVNVIWATLYGRKRIRTEKSDAVFGDPQRTQGGWYWVVTGVSFILLSWLYFSWDSARAFFPKAGNELCQVAKLDYAISPIRSTFPLDKTYLKSTTLLKRENLQLKDLKKRAGRLGLSDAEKSEAESTIALMEAAMNGLTSPEHLQATTSEQISTVTRQINTLEENLRDSIYPGQPTAEQVEKASKMLRWGDSGNEIPIHPESPRGYKFDAVAKEMKKVASDFAKIRNKNPHFLGQVDALQAKIENLSVLTKPREGVDELLVANRADFVKGLQRVLQRIDDGVIFPPNAMDPIQTALVSFEKEKKKQQGSLRFIDSFAMPGGTIEAGSSSCSEQGSGRWLPKPSDTLRTLVRIANPNIGYKGYPLLWYTQKPFGEMVDFFIPDWIASFVPGDYPMHGVNGEINTNLKSKVYDFATGNFNSFSIPVPSGHIWDSLLRVLAGLFLGIILGVPLGLFMGLSRFSQGFFDPIIELYRPVPPLAWAPLILTIFGIQDDGKIFLLFMVAFAIMVISARTGATGTHLSKIHAAHSLGASNRQILRKVILPNSLP
ncbi:MAG: ABC transporter permease subunit, partial [Candidatus Electrothrix sp. AR4]|nr:ABC transporter permease subunit [Candidatus Electrothrix sp. AR4]